ncbi:non-ribosomal peptide synthetase, partial [Candidatus Symbiopectobacterium sp. NZEC135]
SWLRHAQRLQEQVWRDLGHASVSAISVQRALAQRAGNEMQAAPVVFTSMLGVADALAKAVPWPSYTSSQTPQVWLDHQAIDLADGVLLSWDYLEELFLPDMVEQMFTRYCHTLRALAGSDWLAPPIRDLPVAQRQMRLQTNTTGGPMPSHRALHDAFFSQAQQWPERPALWDSVNGYLSYGALREQALTVAAGLLHRGIHAGDCVALCLPSGGDRMVALLGILAAGAAYLPLNQAHPAARHALLCRKGRAKAVICDSDLSFALPTFSLASLRDNAPLTAPIIPPDDALAYVLFTSGSTGEPKGVMIEHRNVLNTLEAVCQQLDISAQDVFLAVSALDFDLSVFDIFAALSVGGLLVLVEDSPHHDADRWLTLMSTHGVSVWNSVPALF